MGFRDVILAQKPQGLKKYILSVSQFFEPTLPDKPLEGRCIVCEQYTRNGHKIDFSNNFTSWNLLGDGDCICEYCYTLCRDQQYRRKSWVATPDGIKFLKREEVLPVLLDPPKIPFAIYITRSGKKQGFLHLRKRVNYSKERYYIAFEDELLFITRFELQRMVDVAKKARELKFPKTELINGVSITRWQYEDLCMQIEELRNNPVWEVVVYAI